MSEDVVPSPPIVVDEQGVVAGDLRCAACSYNLRGLPIDSRCTSCGTRIEVSLAGKTADDAPCRGCSYNLRGLSLDSKCPECGTAVAISLQGDLLRYSPPWWLDRLMLGAALIAGTLLIDTFIASPKNLLQMHLRPMQQAVVLASSVLGFAGTWLLTSRDPARTENRRHVWARRIARFGMAMVLVRAVIISLGNSLFPNLSALIAVGILVAAVARVAGELARLYYLILIAPRIPEEKFKRGAGILCCIYVPSVAVVVITSAIATFGFATLKQPQRWLGAAFLPMMIGFVGTVMSAILYALMLAVLVIVIWDERRIAKAIRTKARLVTQEMSSSTSTLPASDLGGGASGS